MDDAHEHDIAQLVAEASERLAERLLELLALRDLEVRLLQQVNADAIQAGQHLRDILHEAMRAVGLDPGADTPSDFMAVVHEAVSVHAFVCEARGFCRPDTMALCSRMPEEAQRVA